MTAIEQTMLVQTKVSGNHNKFYEVTLNDDGSVLTRWGRVGARGQQKLVQGARGAYESVISKKEARGYTRVQVAGSPSERPVQDAGAIRRALTDSDDSRVQRLIDRIVAVNAHDILGRSGGQISYEDGILRTPLGIIGTAALDQADGVVARIRATTDRRLQIELLEELLTLVPQKVGGRVGWEEPLLTTQGLDRQSYFISQLRDSVRFADQQRAVVQDAEAPRFAYRIEAVDDDSEAFATVSEAFTRSLNRNHPSAAYHLSGLYALTADEDSLAAYVAASKKLGKRGTFWHGTSAANVLSILATGLRVARNPTNGAMFGPGIYLSNQSTKSLNYSTGVWSGSRRGGAFMFSARAVLGKPFHPTSWTQCTKGAPAGYDSIDVAPGTAGVRNHELIVPSADRVNLRYLCEFDR